MLPRNNPIIRSERMMADGHSHMPGQVVHCHDATFQSVKSGNWSDPTVWGTGTVPGTDATVCINEGHRIRYDVTTATPPALLWIHVDGAMVWATSAITNMNVDTIFTSPGSYLEIGRPGSPASTTIIFRDGALLDAGGDEMTRGLMTAGRVMIHGIKTTPYLRLPQTLAIGATSITLTLDEQRDPLTGALRFPSTNAGLDEMVAGWFVGDQITFPKNSATNGGTDVRTIASISKDYTNKRVTITWTGGLTFNHTGKGLKTVPFAAFQHNHNGYIVNESRSITFKSANKNGTRGHIMFMHGRQVRNTAMIYRREDHKFAPSLEEMGDNADVGVDVYYAASVDMGRTRTLFNEGTSTHPRIGEAGNKVGRYSWHWHRVGHWTQRPAEAKGLVAIGNVGWQYVRHDANVHVDYCVGRGLNGETAKAGYQARGGGALFLDEEDTEVSPWTRCIAMDCNSDLNSPGSYNEFNNEYDFNGHGHTGDGFAVNRNAPLRECISFNCRNGIQIHLNQSNTRTPHKNRFAYPEDRRPDWHGIKRFGFVSSMIAAGHNVDHQPAGWYACQAFTCGNGFKIDHRQRAAPHVDMMVILEHCTATDLAGTWLHTFNYTHNYLIHNCSIIKASEFWTMQDKMWGFVWSRNLFEDITTGIGGMFTLGHGGVSGVSNVKGGFVDNTFVNVGQYDSATGELSRDPDGTGPQTSIIGRQNMDIKNYSSSGWPTITPSTDITVGANNTRKPTLTGWITDNLVGRIPLYMPSSLWPSASSPAPDGPMPLGMSHRGGSDKTLQVFIQAPGQNQEDFNRKYTLTIEEMVETWGCYASASGTQHFVKLHFPYRDRLNGTLFWKSIDLEVTYLPLAFRRMHQISASVAAQLPAGADNITPQFVSDPSFWRYAVFPDPSKKILYVVKNDKLIVDAVEEFLTLPYGQVETFNRTIAFGDGTAQPMTFKVVGRALAPGVDPTRRPRIHRLGTNFKTIMRGEDTWTAKWINFDKGRGLGWPMPTAVTVLERAEPHPYAAIPAEWQDAKEKDARFTDWGLKDAFCTRPKAFNGTAGGVGPGKETTGGWDGIIEGWYRLKVAMENDVGSYGPIYSNHAQIITTLTTTVTGTDGQSASLTDAAGTVTDPNAIPANPSYPAQANGTLEFSGSATAKIMNRGNAGGTLPLTGSATGVLTNTSGAIGHAQGSLDFTASAAGKVLSTGRSEGSLPLTGSGIGEAITLMAQGGATGELELTGSATATVSTPAYGNATGELPLSGGITAINKVAGFSSGQFLITATAEAKLLVKGNASGDLNFTASSTGIITMPGEIISFGELPLGGSSTGFVTVKGDIDGMLPLTGSAHAGVMSKADASGVFELTGAAAGKATVSGQASNVIPFTGSSSGKVATGGSSEGSLTFTGSSAGILEGPFGPLEGEAGGTLPLTGSSGGKIKVTGEASGVINFTAQVVHVRRLPRANVSGGTAQTSVTENKSNVKGN